MITKVRYRFLKGVYIARPVWPDDWGLERLKHDRTIKIVALSPRLNTGYLQSCLIPGSEMGDSVVSDTGFHGACAMRLHLRLFI
jgi:hypothetical protein